ncbi:MAG: nucleotide pyrophosphatase/phosphodiesterase family protein [Thermodesulfobacteriota bacterium]
MKKKLLILQAAALSRELSLPDLSSYRLGSVFPALTCVAQASFRTAKQPRDHGMTANGIFCKRLMRPMFWEQSSRLVSGPRIWDAFRKKGGTVGMFFWQQSLGEDVDLLLSPAPIHKHHGGMIESAYEKPAGLYQRLCDSIGRPFTLRHYWGPLASHRSGDWIAEALGFILTQVDLAPDLVLAYLPTLDYALQRFDPENSRQANQAYAHLARQVSDLVSRAREAGYQVLVFGDYKIAPVSHPVFPNRTLARAGLFRTRPVAGMQYPDFYQSAAFAMVDHEIAHVHVFDKRNLAAVADLFYQTPGVRLVLDRKMQAEHGIDHETSGDLVLVAEEGAWFSYPWWAENHEAPDYASHVDIHNKPGYDPAELFFGWPPGSVSRNPMRIKGSHGRVGAGREVVALTSLSLPQAADLVGLAGAVKSWLAKG